MTVCTEKNVKPEFEQAIQNQETVTKAETEKRECALAVGQRHHFVAGARPKR
jgi:hypothetical protein